jgi:hypothetical protein
MNNTLAKIVTTGALVGALAVASAVPTQAAQGRNAAFAAGVAARALGGAALGGGYGAYPAYGGYYGGPRYAYSDRPYRHRYYRHHWYR